MSMCRVISSVAGRGFLLWLVHSLDKTLLALASAWPCTLRLNLPVTLGISWLPTFAFYSPIMKRHLFYVLVLESLVGLHRTVQIQYFQLSHRLGLLWYWMVCLGNEQRTFCFFEIAHKNCILVSFVDCEGYSISSKGFLPTVVDIMVI